MPRGLVCLTRFDLFAWQEVDAAAAPTTEEVKKSNHVARKLEKRQQNRVLDAHIEDQFNSGRLMACISSRPGQCGRADGYVTFSLFCRYTAIFIVFKTVQKYGIQFLLLFSFRLHFSYTAKAIISLHPHASKKNAFIVFCFFSTFVTC